MSNVDRNWMNFPELDDLVDRASVVTKYVQKQLDEGTCVVSGCDDVDFNRYVADLIIEGKFGLSLDYPGGVHGFYNDHRDLFPEDFVLKGY